MVVPEERSCCKSKGFLLCMVAFWVHLGLICFVRIGSAFISLSCTSAKLCSEFIANVHLHVNVHTVSMLTIGCELQANMNTFIFRM